jgi:group II intron reverse transcriptase/maturase
MGVVSMAQQFDYPKSETGLRVTLDALYQSAKTAYERGERPAFKGLIEIMSAEATIITAIHNIKSNKGSETPGVDGKKMQKDYLQKPFKWVIKDIQNAFSQYIPQKIRREYIDKPGKTEKRPLGIPTIRDRICQECIRIVLEPILEAQFFEHSYGFRPMRDTHQALARVTNLVYSTGYYWIVEGDISKCFDTLSHGVLLKRLYHMGIKDRRVIQTVKAMMKAGIIGECEINEDGVQQGGVLSPLLANVSLDILDEWISRQWENKITQYSYSGWETKSQALRNRSKLIPGYLIRYADDFVVITDSREHAECWRTRIQAFLRTEMKLTLSPEKTLITDVRKQYIRFLGYEYKVVKGKGAKGYITRTIPDRERLQRKVDATAREIKDIPHNKSREEVINDINRINSKIRGIVNYYSSCTWVSRAMSKHAWQLNRTAMRRLKQYKSEWIPAKETRNLPRVHENYRTKIPAISCLDMYIGVTSLSFCRWENQLVKNREETPFTKTGRDINFKRTKRKRQNDRLDELYSDRTGEIILQSKWGKHFNFEFYMNRAYALNRDKLKCRVCGGWLISCTPHAHRINPNLPQNMVNKVSNLASVHENCLEAINNQNADITTFDAKSRKKIEDFRKRLVQSHVKTTV